MRYQQKHYVVLMASVLEKQGAYPSLPILPPGCLEQDVTAGAQKAILDCENEENALKKMECLERARDPNSFLSALLMQGCL